MATASIRKTLKRAEYAAIQAMSDEQLEEIIAGYPPDPEFDAAIRLLTDDELQAANDELIDRDQILAIGRHRSTDTPCS